MLSEGFENVSHPLARWSFLTRSGQLLASRCTLNKELLDNQTMNFYRVLLALLAVLLSFNVSSVVSQEAVDSERSGKSSEETATEETPAESAKKKGGEEKPRRSLQEMMRPEEFKAAGLDKLTEEELQHLDAWLQGYRATTEKKASEQAEKKADEEIKKATEQASARTAKTKFDRLVSRVDGSFEGLKGRTIIKLEDGTVWKQANLDDRYRPQVTDHPLVSVTHSAFGYKMRVEGTPEFYVNPVRNP
jgi:hypothetical protein